jgi:hypothetical protein
VDADRPARDDLRQQTFGDGAELMPVLRHAAIGNGNGHELDSGLRAPALLLG